MKLKRFGAVLVAMVLCLNFCSSAFAADETNTQGVTFSATLADNSLTESSSSQSVTLTIAASKEVALDSLEYNVVCPKPLSVETHTLSDALNSGGITSWTPAAKELSWMASGNDVNTTQFATIVISVPANVTGTFTVGIDTLLCSSNFEYWEKGASATTTLTIASSGGTEPTISVTGVSLNKEETTLIVGGTETLTATVVPDNATDKTVTWTSSDTSVATVADGVVTALKAGTTTIKATANDGSGKSASCTVTVGENTLQSIVVSGTFDTDYLVLEEANWDGLVVTAYYADLSSKVLSSSEYSISNFDTSGITTGEDQVTRTVTVTYEGKSDTFDITVSKRTVGTLNVSTDGCVGGHTYRSYGHWVYLYNGWNNELSLPDSKFVVYYIPYANGAEVGTKTTSRPVNVGQYNVYYTFEGNNYWKAVTEPVRASYRLTIVKATPTVTAPTAKTGLTYTGSAQDLVNAGSTTGGTLQYSLDNAVWGIEIPTGAAADTYTVYYRVVGDDNYNDVAAKSVSVTINTEAHTCGNGTFQQGQPATCTADGWKDYYKCTCTNLYEDEACTTEIADLAAWKVGAGKISATNHSWGTITYTWADNGSRCDAKRVCTKNSTHVETAVGTITNVEKTPAGCTTVGTTTYTATFSKDWAVTQTKDVQDIPATNHSWGTITYTWADNGSSCVAKRVCTKDNTHVETAVGTITSAEKTPATETVKGTTTYTATFSKDWAVTQTKDVQDIPVASHEHTWGTVTYTFAADGSSCVAKRVCTKDSTHVETAVGTITGAEKTPAGCTTVGTTTYTATFINDWAVTQTKDVQDIPATDHSWGTVSYTFAADGSSCVAKRVCTKDSNHVETVNAIITNTVKTPANCAVKGTTTYTAVFSKDWATTQTKDVQDIVINADAHSWGAWTPNGATGHKRVCAHNARHIDVAAHNYGGDNTCDNCSYTKSSSGSVSSGCVSNYYSVTSSSSGYGTVSTSPRTSATKGQTVTVTVVPNNGYKVSTLTVTDTNGDAVTLTKVSDTEYTFKMPAGNVSVKATFAKIVKENPFTDVAAGSYYYDAVLWAVENGITNGNTATTFNPTGVCTRAHAVTFLWRAAGSPAPKSTTCNFTDVAKGSYYYDAVLWAVENGITNGTTETTFAPNAQVTRAQNVTFLNRWAKASAKSAINPFKDVANGSYYYNAVLWAVENGITNGTTATTFNPADSCTRAQIVTFLYRYMKG